MRDFAAATFRGLVAEHFSDGDFARIGARTVSIRALAAVPVARGNEEFPCFEHLPTETYYAVPVAEHVTVEIE